MKLLSAGAIRRCFRADPGHLFISSDFNQIELRIAAAMAGENVLIEAAKRGEHLIKATALRLFGEGYTQDQYRYTKNVVYGWLFGGGAKTLSDQAGIPIGDAFDIIKDFEKAFDALTRFKWREQDLVLRQALSTVEYKLYRTLKSRMSQFRGDTRAGRSQRKSLQIEIDRLLFRRTATVVTPFGRPLIVEADKSYRVVNYKVQSTARDIMASAFLRVMADEELNPTVLLLIHDEILGQARKRHAERIAIRLGDVMTTEFMGVPITATGKVLGRSWGDGYDTAA